jgi:hypothetical protein
MKLLSTQTHGMVDYATGGALVALPRALGWSDNVTNLLTMAGLGAIAYSLFTRYELGLFKVLPMQTHLTMDALSGLTLATAPLWLNERDDTVNKALVGIGLFEIMAALSTETQPGQHIAYQQVQEIPVPRYIPINAGGVERTEEGVLNA